MKIQKCLTLSLLAAASTALPLEAQLFDNLRALGAARIEVADRTKGAAEGPKGLVSGDFDLNGHQDWAVSRLDGKIVIGWGIGDGKFVEPPQVVATEAKTFRQIIAADLNADGKPDLAAADPFSGTIFIVPGNGGRTWAAPVLLPTWAGARNLIAADMTGDGVLDLIVGGSDKNVAKIFEKPWLAVPEPLPAQPATGLMLYRNDGAGQFTRAAVGLKELATVSQPPEDDPDSFPRPVYVLESWQGMDAGGAKLVATHALANTVWLIAADPTVPAGMKITRAVNTGNDGVRALAAGPITSDIASGTLQIISASRDLGSVSIYRQNAAGDWIAGQRLDIPGGPRAMRLLDINKDGWNDLAVVSRNTDKLLLFLNRKGLLVNETEALTGRSPREMTSADFNGDGRMDLLTLNRNDFSVSAFLGGTFGDDVQRSGFAALDQTYPTSGDIAQLGLHDLNKDGRADVLQLHRASGEASVRMSGPGGRLAEPVFYKMGSTPSAFSLGDINKDGREDLISANMGDAEGGFVAVRYGDGAGGFGALERFRPPLEPTGNRDIDPNGPPPTGGNGFKGTLPAGVKDPYNYGQLYAVLQTDLDGDGYQDLAAGYYDCRIIFFKGDGKGGFTPTEGFSDHDLYFLTGYEARIIADGDFDQDGDKDLALTAWPGDIVILENTGNFFLQRSKTDKPYIRHFFPRLSNKFAGARDMSSRDENGDGDPDLIIGTGAGIQVLYGGRGVSFSPYLNPPLPGDSLPIVPGMDFPITAMIQADLDNDGQKDDMAAICTDDGCLNVFTQTAAGLGSYVRVVQVDVPLTKWLATGDIDGDGKTDLAGSGDTLWIALSGREQKSAAPLVSQARPSLAKLCINEIFTDNDSVLLPHPTDPGAPSLGRYDCVELFNGTAQPVSLAGWSLEVVDNAGTRRVALGAVSLEPKKHFSIPFTKSAVPFASGFALQKEGCFIRLKNAASVVDGVSCPALMPDRSYARFSDGDPDFHINRFPDPGSPNLDNGAEEPDANLTGVDMGTFQPGLPLRFYATALDDVGVVGMTLHWRVRGAPEFRTTLMFDDGMNNDGARLDGVFAGLLPAGLEPGAELEIYLETEDLSGTKKYLPGKPAAISEEGLADEVYTLRLPDGTPQAALEISEIMPSASITAWTGGLTDWMEIRNASAQPLDLTGIEITEDLFGGARRLKITSQLATQNPTVAFTLQPGSYMVLPVGNAPPAGAPFYLPFGLSATRGGQVSLMRRLASGTQELVQNVAYPALGESGKSWARMGRNGNFFVANPTPASANAHGVEPLGAGADGFYLAIAPATGVPWKLEEASNLTGPWASTLSGTGDGYEKVLIRPMASPRQFYRIR